MKSRTALSQHNSAWAKASAVERVEVVLVHGDAKQAALAHRRRSVDHADLARGAVRGELEDPTGVTLADQRRLAAEGDRPGRFQTLRYRFDACGPPLRGSG